MFEIVKSFFLETPEIQITQIEISRFLDQVINRNGQQLHNLMHCQRFRFIEISQISEMLIDSLLERFSSAQTVQQVTKLLFALISTLRAQKFQHKYFDQNWQINLQKFNQKVIQSTWAVVLIRSLVVYLNKMSGLSDIHRNALFKMQIQKKEHMTTIYRIINQIPIILPHMTNALNTIGRYFYVLHQNIRMLLSQIGEQIYNIYQYLKYLLNEVFQHYNEYDRKQLRCLLSAINEIQTAATLFEDFLINKYYEGQKKLTHKIGFKEQVILEIDFFLSKNASNNQKKTKKQHLQVSVLKLYQSKSTKALLQLESTLNSFAVSSDEREVKAIEQLNVIV